MLTIFKENPNGTKENLNTLIQYEVMYFTSTKEYVVNVQPCNKTQFGFECNVTYSDHNLTLRKVARQSAKHKEFCENFLKQNVESIHKAYLANGIAGAKEAVRDLIATA